MGLTLWDMNIKQADQAILSGEWHQIVTDLAEACLRHRAAVREGSYLWSLWGQRAELLFQATAVGNDL